MIERPFKQVDVFTAVPFKGNPVAVVLDARGLSDVAMQAIARWTNLSETTFVLPSEVADYRLRIFTPAAELPFAGHPTIGSAHAVLEAGIVKARDGVLTQACGIGVVTLRVGPEGLMATIPTPRRRETAVEVARLERAIGAAVAEPIVFDTGAVWLVGRVADEAALNALKPSLDEVAALTQALETTGITLYGLDAAGGVHVRSFCPADGIPEDPVCGSGNACVAAHLKATGGLSRTGNQYEARQGVCVGRDGRVAIRVEETTVSLGGRAVTVIDGVIRWATE